MYEHTCFVTLSWAAIEIGWLSQHDSLSFVSQRLIVCNCVSVFVYVHHSVSDRATFTQTLNFGGVLFPDPIRCCQSHKLNTFLSLSHPSFLVSLPLSNTYSLLHYASGFVFFSRNLQFIRGARETSSVILEN